MLFKSEFEKKVAQFFAFVFVSTPSILAIFFPATAHALNIALVPCGNNPFVDECTLCDVLQLIGNVTKFIILDVAAPVATLLIAWSGAKILVNGANPAARSEAKGILKNVVIGFLVIIFAWSIVLTIMKVLLGKDDLTPWTSFQCDTTRLNSNLPPVVDLNNMQGGNNGAVSATLAQRREADDRNRRDLGAVGVDINNPNMCTGSQTTGCTSVDGLQADTITYINLMRQKYQSTVCSGGGVECRWVLTGGSEVHSGGTADGTHGGGDKFDLRLSTVRESFITPANGFTRQSRLRDDGATVWKDSLGNEWAKEGDHWDVKVVRVR